MEALSLMLLGRVSVGYGLEAWIVTHAYLGVEFSSLLQGHTITVFILET